MRLSLVIPTKNRPDEILRALESVYEHSPQIEEVIVVDQSAQPYALPERPHLVHLYRPELSGLTAARNAGIDASHGEIVLFLDDDCLFVNDVVAETLAVFDAHPGAVGVQSRLADRTYNPPPLSARIFEHGFFDVNSPGPDDDLRRTSGAGCAFRRTLFAHERFDDVGLRGYCYGEDYDFSLRARKYGKLVFAANAVVEHRPSAANRFDRRGSFETRWNNLNYLYAKHHARATLADRMWHAWWRLGETLQWLRFGLGLPPRGLSR
ncbi:MAG TPA: glycosyltransferase family A protein [Candidatus Elarobacter sp.]|nr:glycosyltransferase family A protein [Candidatus Elarobacter sp.]